MHEAAASSRRRHQSSSNPSIHSMNVRGIRLPRNCLNRISMRHGAWRTPLQSVTAFVQRIHISKREGNVEQGIDVRRSRGKRLLKLSLARRTPPKIAINSRPSCHPYSTNVQGGLHRRRRMKHRCAMRRGERLLKLSITFDQLITCT